MSFDEKTTNTGSIVEEPLASSESTDNNMEDLLLTEIERQEKYLSKLPDDFKFPLFNTHQALESQRKSGYRDTGSAAREIVDNAWEAGARKIDIVFEHGRSERGRDLVQSIAFIDNGAGMLPKMIQYALSLGGGTHFEEPRSIGKFGFGLPNSSINQTRRVEVYSRVRQSDPIMRGVLDVTEYASHGLQEVKAPEKAELPKFVTQYLKKNGLEFQHGTVVVWVKPDRLTYKMGAKLKEHLLDDFGVTYRYILDELVLTVEGQRVEMVDPLFLDPRGRYYLPPDPEGADDAGGAVEVYNRTIVLKHFIDPDTLAARVEKVDDESELDRSDPSLITYGTVGLRVSRLPYGFAALPGKTARDEFSESRLAVRQNGRGISFVRAGREIEAVKTLPHTKRDKSAGLGNWPTLISYDYHWAAEVSFSPELDDVFGITNDKQKVRPLEDFWRVLASDDIAFDRQLRKEHSWQDRIRKEKAEERKKASIEEKLGATAEPSGAESAAASVEVTTGKKTRIPDRDKPAVKIVTDNWVENQLNINDGTEAEVRQALEKERQRRPYKVVYINDQHSAFYEPQWGPLGQVQVKVNKDHLFFKSVYETLLSIEGGKAAKEAIDILLIALSKAELECEHDQTKETYRVQRSEVWSPFISKALKAYRQMDSAGDGELEVDDAPDEEKTDK